VAALVISIDATTTPTVSSAISRPDVRTRELLNISTATSLELLTMVQHQRAWATSCGLI
jgi:hypothetical protein